MLRPFLSFFYRMVGGEACDVGGWAENQIESIKMITSFHGPSYSKFSFPHFTPFRARPKELKVL